jgi:hypothetical protein
MVFACFIIFVDYKDENTEAIPSKDAAKIFIGDDGLTLSERDHLNITNPTDKPVNP